MTGLAKFFVSLACFGACFGTAIVSFSSSTTFAAVENDSSTGVSKTLPAIRRAEGVDETKPTLGILGGITSTADQNRIGSSIALEYAMQPVVPFGAAVELGIADQHDQLATISRTKLLFKGNYNFGGTIPVIKNSYLGLGLGPVWDRVNGTNDVELGVVPQIGFDIPIGERPANWSLGANANYLFVGGAKSQVLALNGVAKYWF
jgi:hypothetical protein